MAAVEKVQLEQQLLQKENQQQISEIENKMHSDKERAQADAELYRALKEAEANKIRLTPEFLQLEAVRALANNTKVFWGEKLPSLYSDATRLVEV